MTSSVPKNWGKKTKVYCVGSYMFDSKTLANEHVKRHGGDITTQTVISKKIKVSSAKAKGRMLQQYVAGKIGSLLNITVGKDELIESREMGQAGSDVKLIGEAGIRFPFAIECKNTKSWSVSSYIEQCSANLKPNQNYLVFMKKPNQKPVVVLDADVFFDYLDKVGL